MFRALQIIITLADLYNPEQSQLYGKHSNTLKSVKASILNIQKSLPANPQL